MAILLGGNSNNQSSSSFDLSKDFRINQEFSILPDSSLVLKFILGANTLLTFSSLEVDQGGVKYSVYVGAQSTETTPFNTVVPIYRRNSQTTAPITTSLNSIFTGGTANFTGVSNSVIRVRTSSGNGARSSSVAAGSQQRGFPPTTVYLQLLPLGGINTTSTGVINLEWSER